MMNAASPLHRCSSAMIGLAALVIACISLFGTQAQAAFGAEFLRIRAMFKELTMADPRPVQNGPTGIRSSAALAAEFLRTGGATGELKRLMTPRLAQDGPTGIRSPGERV